MASVRRRADDSTVLSLCAQPEAAICPRVSLTVDVFSVFKLKSHRCAERAVVQLSAF